MTPRRRGCFVTSLRSRSWIPTCGRSWPEGTLLDGSCVSLSSTVGCGHAGRRLRRTDAPVPDSCPSTAARPEIGTFFGYSAIHIARGCPSTAIGQSGTGPRVCRARRRNLRTAGVDEKVEVIAGAATDHLRTVAPKSVDMIFIDADKNDYPEYLKLCYPALTWRHPGADDAFAHGDFSAKVMEPSDLRDQHVQPRCRPRPPSVLRFVGTNNGLMVSYKM